MKTNIKMKCDDSQFRKVMNILKKDYKKQYHYENMYIIIINDLNAECEEIDSDLFIRTNGSCEENQLKDFIQSQNENIDRVNDWIKQFNDVSLKLKKKNEILKKARIKRKNQREELHKLNLKLQKCISLGEHRKVLDWHIERNESLFAEIDKLKAENKSLKESSKISCNMLHSQKDTIVSLRDDVINKVDNITYNKNKEIEKLKAVIEYLESKVK